MHVHSEGCVARWGAWEQMIHLSSSKIQDGQHVEIEEIGLQLNEWIVMVKMELDDEVQKSGYS